MPSPDLSAYVDLTLHDRDAQQLVDLAIADLTGKLPELTLREGHVEAVLIEAHALIGAELVYAINRLPNATVDALFRLYGINRNVGTPPVATLRFTVADAAGYSIPTGTRVNLPLAAGRDPVAFTTNAGLLIPVGATTGDVTATGDRLTADANGTPAGTTVELLDAIVAVNTVKLATAVTGGTGPESDETWRTRAVTRLGRLNDALVSPRHFELAALERVDVTRARAINNYNPAATTGGPGDHPGYIAVAVYGPGGAVPAAAKADLDTAYEDRALANLSVAVIDPTVTAVAVTTAVRRLPGFDDATVRANVTAALRAYLDPQSWPFSGTVRRNELIATISNAAGVDYVDTLTDPAGDVALAGVAPLATAGTITVTTLAP